MDKLSKFNIKTLFLLIIIAVLLFDKCSGENEEKPKETIKIDGKKYEVIKRETEIKYIDKIKIVNKKGEDIYHDTTIYVSVPQDVDTAKILAQYYAKNVYKDTLRLDDSLGYVSVIDTIKENKILYRTFDSKVREKIVDNKIYIKEPAKRQLYIGTYVGLNQSDILKTLNVGLIYKTKKDKMFHLGAGVINQTPNNLSPVINGGVFWKIRIKQ